MTSSSFATAFSVEKSPEEAFNAIKNIRGWWSEEIEGRTDKVGDGFTYHYKDMHRCTMRLTEAVPGKKVVWLVLDNYFDFTKELKLDVALSKDCRQQRCWRRTNLARQPTLRNSRIGKHFCQQAPRAFVPGRRRNLIVQVSNQIPRRFLPIHQH
jgi:hypothetical protein